MNWKEQRQNIIDMYQKFPGDGVNCIDSAILLGLEQGREEVKKMCESMNKPTLPKKILNPFYPEEGTKYIIMQGNVNFMEGYNRALQDILSQLQVSDK